MMSKINDLLRKLCNLLIRFGFFRKRKLFQSLSRSCIRCLDPPILINIREVIKVINSSKQITVVSSSRRCRPMLNSRRQLDFMRLQSNIMRLWTSQSTIKISRTYRLNSSRKVHVRRCHRQSLSRRSKSCHFQKNLSTCKQCWKSLRRSA